MICFASASYSQGWFRQPTPNDTLRSTVVLPDNSVIFQIYAPKAETVSLTGDLPWDKPVHFRKMDDGVWKGRLSPMEDGVYRYKFIVERPNVVCRGKAARNADVSSRFRYVEGVFPRL